MLTSAHAGWQKHQEQTSCDVKKQLSAENVAFLHWKLPWKQSAWDFFIERVAMLKPPFQSLGVPQCHGQANAKQRWHWRLPLNCECSAAKLHSDTEHWLINQETPKNSRSLLKCLSSAFSPDGTVLVLPLEPGLSARRGAIHKHRFSPGCSFNKVQPYAVWIRVVWQCFSVSHLVPCRLKEASLSPEPSSSQLELASITLILAWRWLPWGCWAWWKCNVLDSRRRGQQAMQQRRYRIRTRSEMLTDCICIGLYHQQKLISLNSKKKASSLCWCNRVQGRSLSRLMYVYPTFL